MHNGGVRSDRPADDIAGVGQVDNDDLILFVDLLSYADEVVGFKCQCLRRQKVGRERVLRRSAADAYTRLEGDGCWLDAEG